MFVGFDLMILGLVFIVNKGIFFVFFVFIDDEVLVLLLMIMGIVDLLLMGIGVVLILGFVCVEGCV